MWVGGECDVGPSANISEMTMETETAQIWVCTSCGFIYDPEEGIPTAGSRPARRSARSRTAGFAPCAGPARPTSSPTRSEAAAIAAIGPFSAEQASSRALVASATSLSASEAPRSRPQSLLGLRLGALGALQLSLRGLQVALRAFDLASGVSALSGSLLAGRAWAAARDKSAQPDGLVVLREPAGLELVPELGVRGDGVQRRASAIEHRLARLVAPELGLDIGHQPVHGGTRARPPDRRVAARRLRSVSPAPRRAWPRRRGGASRRGACVGPPC